MKNIKKSQFIILLICFNLIITSNGCKKFVEVDAPTNSVNSDNVYEDIQTATAVLNGLYTKMASGSGSFKYVAIYSGLSSDELTLFYIQNSIYQAFFANSLTSNTDTSFWLNYYNLIYKANSAIEGLMKSKKLSTKAKNQLIGEAKFIRAYLYFYLVNFYGDIPLSITSDVKENLLLARSEKKDVYKQIILDLKEAQTLLTSDYVDVNLTPTNVERVRPNKLVATAMLARVYLYTEDFKNAEIESSILINNSIYKLEPLNSTFLIDSKEAIWQLYGVGTGINSNTEEGRFFILPITGPSSQYPVYLSNELYNSFEQGDQRKVNWVKTISVLDKTYPFSYKYKVGLSNSTPVEYSVVLRLAEQYLIRAEARIQLNKVSEGIADLNVIRSRATDVSSPTAQQLSQLSASVSKSDAIRALEIERYHELFTEGGHRWLDLKRINGFSDPSKKRADEILSIVKANNWQSSDQLYPIPQYDLDQSPNLAGHQNPGY